MRHYEVVAVVHPDQQGRIGAMIESYKKIVADGGGVVHRLEDWGRRPLAYPIKNQHKAQYLLLNIECEDPTLARLREAFRFSDFVLRSLIVRRDRAIIDPSPIAVERTQKAAARAAALAESREKVHRTRFARADKPADSSESSASSESPKEAKANGANGDKDSAKEESAAKSESASKARAESKAAAAKKSESADESNDNAEDGGDDNKETKE